MLRQPRRLAPFAVLATAAIVFGACSGTAATASPSAAPSAPPATATAAAPSVAPATATAAPATATATAAPTAAPVTPSGPAFTAQVYPDTAVDCKNPPAGYTGEFSQIKALDRLTVEFDLCTPDPAFLSKIAFSSNPIIDSDYLAAHVPDGSIITTPNGTGPYKLKEWVKGDHMTFEANTDYWGDQAKTPTAILRWSTEAAQRLTELKAGTVDGIDNPGTDDFAAIQADTSLQLIPRQALNVFYLGMNVLDKPWDNEKVRQAIAYGIDRKRIIDNFYPPGSIVADYFTPCAVKYACLGDKWPDFDLAKAKQLLADAGFPNGFKTKIQYRDVVRGYLPNATQVAQDVQAQLKKNLNIDATIEVQQSATYLDNNAAGKLDGLFLLGWTADFPDITDFLDVHFGAGSGKKFGKPLDDVAAAITKGGTTTDDAVRTQAYTDANNLLIQHVPMVPVAHGGSATVWKADVVGAHSSPLGVEQLYSAKPADRPQLVFMQNAEPNSLFCMDETDGETIRACIQIYESLYGFTTGGLDTQPILATECKPNTELTVWTCTLRDNVKFDDGSTLDANDVVVSFAMQWDTKHPLHKGRTSAFEYFPGLFGGFLNPPPALVPGRVVATLPAGLRPS